MPRRKNDATPDDVATPEPSDGGGENRSDATLASESHLPPGAESESAPRVEEAAPVEAVTVDAVAVDTPPLVEEPVSDPVPETAVPEVVEAEDRRTADEDFHDEPEEEGRSLAGKVLTGLVILLAGAALGLWAGPKIAPMLPSGMKPVADWLAPGKGEAEAEMAALRAEVGDGLGDVQSRVASLPTAGDVDQRIGAAVGAAQGALVEQIEGLKQAVGHIDPVAVRQQLDQLAAVVKGQTAELDALKGQIAGSAGEVGAAAAEKIDVYRGEIDALRAEMGALQENVSGMAARLEGVAADAQRQVQAAQDKVNEVQTRAADSLGAAEAGAAAALVRAGVASGQPFADALGQLSGRSGVTVPQGLADVAATGVPTLAQLRDSFPDDAHAAIRASIMASAGTGVLARSQAFLEAQVSSRSLAPQSGMTPDAILSRMEDKLRRDDLAGVLAEAQSLPSEAAAAMQGWLDSVRRRVAAEDGLATLDSTLPASQ